MKKMKFSNLVNQSGIILCNYVDNDGSNTLEFNLIPAITPSNDLIAIALSTLCGRNNYDEITFDFAIKQETIEKLKTFTHANIIANIDNAPNNTAKIEKTNGALSFSGGFDSLAAKCLMPDNTKLVSMDFGGKFAREGIFFSKFPTHIVKTNILETPLKKNSWSFMGIAAILFSDHLGIKYHTFGGILEASSNNFSKKPVAAKNVTFPPFESAGMVNAPYVLGITEIGTAMILLTYTPDLIIDSLNSVANNGESKKYRKQLIAVTAAKRMKIPFHIDKFDKPNHKFIFGKSFADDFLVFYFIKYSGLELTQKLVENIPEEVIELANKLTLKFYERINTNFLEFFPQELLSGLLDKAANASILPYTKQDWDELEEVTNLLRLYHKI